MAQLCWASLVLLLRCLGRQQGHTPELQLRVNGGDLGNGVRKEIGGLLLQPRTRMWGKSEMNKIEDQVFAN